ncbi:MAG: VOC family protein [Myxococcota bacterium]|nr:VOC family protein [Myxococcota bacterium]
MVQLDHVAVAVKRIEDALPVVVSTLGGQPGRAGPGDGFDWYTWSFLGGGSLEVLIPNGPPDGFLRRFLKTHGPGIHHLTFYVPDLRKACDLAEHRGYRIVGYNDSHADWQEAFLFPKQALGIVVQLARSSPEHESEGYGRNAATPKGEPPDPVRFVGLRMAAPSEAAARRLFEDALRGKAGEIERGLAFSWPESPLRVAVEIDPDAPVGPVGLEFESQREIPLLAAPALPELGARLLVARD